MDIALAIGFFVLLAGLIAIWGYLSYVKPARIRQRLGETITEPAAVAPVAAPHASPGKMVVKIVHRIGEKVPISPQDTRLARRYLIAAGYRSDRAITTYYGFKIILAIVGFGVGLLIRPYIANPVGGIAILVGLTAGGFFLPNFIVERLISRRQEALRLSLPDALDLLVVCMEAGLGLDQAISAVARELRTTHPEISEELGLVTLEMRHGKRRAEALKNLADRTAEPEVRKLVATMVQADRFGTGVGEALRTHSDFMRVRRRQLAEERAGKVGVKLVFPIFFFILPAMMIVAAGPGVLALMKNLFPMMRNM
jgi:tight adherence protein C